MSTGLAPTELDRHIRKAALLPGPGAYHPRRDAVAQRIRHVNIKETKSTSSPLLAGLGLLQILIFIGLMETQTWRFLDGSWPGQVPAGKAPGDVAGDFWVRYTDPEEKAYKLNIELNNGRAAMMGITGMLMHDHITGSWVPPGF